MGLLNVLGLPEPRRAQLGSNAAPVTKAGEVQAVQEKAPQAKVQVVRAKTTEAQAVKARAEAKAQQATQADVGVAVGATASGAATGNAIRSSKESDDAVADSDKMEVAAQKPLGVIKYRGRNFTLWAMTDPAGAIVRGGNRLQATLAKMNEIGDAAVKAVAQLHTLEVDWQQKVEVVRKAAVQSAADIKKVDAQKEAMRKRRLEDGDLAEDVHNYLSAMDDAEDLIGHIRSAEHGLKQAALTLESDELWEKANDKDNQVQDGQKAVADKEAEIAEAKRIAGGILDVVEKVVKQDWAGLAAKALEFARDKAIDASVEAQFGRDLTELKAKLATAQSELKNLKIEALRKVVEASREGVAKALSDLDVAKRGFGSALKGLARLQTMASDSLKKSNSTAKMGDMLAQRSKQLHAIAAARTACERYGQISANARKNMTLVANKYGAVGSWLDGAAAADPVFDRSKPYAKILERSALGNAVELGRWDNWIEGKVQDDCTKSLAWLADAGNNGPMVHFERAIAIAHEVLSTA